MADLTFNTTNGQTIARELLVLYLNTGTADKPVWSPLGSRVEDSSEKLDWSEKSSQDILGVTRSTAKKPVITQSFEPCDLDSEDAAIVKVWNVAIHDQDPHALTNFDVMVAHLYAGEVASPFAERYPSSMVIPSGLGGEGGGNVTMPLDVTFGGERQVGTATKDIATGAVTFTKAA